MKKLLFSLSLITAAFVLGSTTQASSALNNWTNSSVSSISSSYAQGLACDGAPLYIQLYHNYNGVMVDYFKNTSSIKEYLWKYKVFTYGNNVVYNPSTYPGKDNGLVIFNRNKLNADNWTVNAGQTVRHLTTAEEVGSPATFGYPWTFTPYTTTVANNYGSFTFHTPNYRNDGTNPATPSVGSAYDAEVRFLTFYDTDNNNTTTADNQGEVECARIQIRWCGDGIYQSAYGEQCDLGAANGTVGSTCSSTCQTIVPFVPKPDLTITKSVTGSTVQGGTVTYKINFSNIGSGAATGVVVTDVLGTGMDYVSSIPTATSVTLNSDGTTTIKYNIGTVAAYANGVITMTTKIRTDALSCSTVRNNVSIAAVTPELTLTNNASFANFQIDCPPVLLKPDLAIVKSVTGSYVQSGTVVYRINFNNIGSGAATGVVVTDVLGTGIDYVSSSFTPSSVVNNINGTTTITFNIGSMAAYANGIITMTTKVKGNTANCVTVQNGVSIATNNDLTLTNNAGSATFQMQCPINPNLWITKSVIASTGGYMPNGYAVYTIAFGNAGSGTATGVVISDTLTGDLMYVSATPSPAIVSGQALVWNVGTLAPGQQGLIKITVKIKSTVPVCQSYIVDNIGKVTASNATSAQANTIFTVLCFDLYANKIIDKPLVVSGDIVTYTINYGNSGSFAAPNRSLVDSLPSGLQYISGSVTILSGANIGNPIVSGNISGGQNLTWTGFTNMAAGYRGLVSIKAQIIGPVTSGHVYLNTVCIVGDNNYNNNNCGTATTTVTGGVTPFFDLTLSKSIDRSTANIGDAVTYTITVRNESDVTAPVNGYTVQDYLPAGVDYLGSPTGPSGMVLTMSGTKDIIFSNLPQLNPGDSIVIKFQGTYRSTTTETNYAEICSYVGVSATSGIKDRDSNPCNRGRANGTEDDESQASVGPIVIITGGGGGGGGGGSHLPYCGDGLYQPSRGEQCDPGNPALGIKPSGVPAGKVCRPDCTYETAAPSITAQVKCSYIDPPAINVGEYMPYWWDMEYDYNQTSGGQARATSFCSSRTGDTRINTNSLQCYFELQGPNGQKIRWTQGCYDNPHLPLIDTAFNSAKITYGMNIFPGGMGAKQITGLNYLGLGEYLITMKVVSGRQCNGAALQPFDRVCQMNFAVTKQYAVARNTQGTSSSTKDLPVYKRQDPLNSSVLNTSEMIKTLQAFTLGSSDKNLISQMIDKYVSLAVKADVITDKLPDNTTIQKAIVSKVPSKSIFVIDAKTSAGLKGSITVSDKATYQGGAFTLIVINGDLVVKGDMKQNSNGMFIVRDGDLIFSANSDTTTNNQNQEVKGIFIGLGNVRAEGDGQPAFNNNLNKPWINGGRLIINGILLGGDLNKMIVGRRSVVEDWFNKNLPEGLFDDGSIVIKANPAIFTNLPPGAEDLSLTLNVFKN